MKDTTFKIRISEKELDAAKVQANAAGMSVAELLRAKLRGAVVVAQVDTETVSELRRLGGLCKHLFSEGVDPAATGSALKALENAAARLAPKS